jgi:hypothetical protein
MLKTQVLGKTDQLLYASAVRAHPDLEASNHVSALFGSDLKASMQLNERIGGLATVYI